MESYDNLDSQIQQLEGAGILDLDIFSTAGPQTFPSQPAAPHGAPPRFHAPEFPSQPRGYAPRSYGYQGFPRSFPLQAHDAGRPVNIVLPNSGTEAQRYIPLLLQCPDSTDDNSLLILSNKVERLEHEVQELTRAMVRFQEETKASLERLKDGLENFMSSITIADQQLGDTPRESPGVGRE